MIECGMPQVITTRWYPSWERHHKFSWGRQHKCIHNISSYVKKKL